LRFNYPRDGEGYYFSTCAVQNFTADAATAVAEARRSFFMALGEC
jgi:hypothetical protein